MTSIKQPQAQNIHAFFRPLIVGSTVASQHFKPNFRLTLPEGLHEWHRSVRIQQLDVTTFFPFYLLKLGRLKTIEFVWFDSAKDSYFKRQ